MTKPVSLTVHKNTIERRRKRTMARELATHAERMMRECDLRAYAIIGIGADGKPYAVWDTGAIMPMWAFPETMAAALRASIEQEGIEDDWRPPMERKA